MRESAEQEGVRSPGLLGFGSTGGARAVKQGVPVADIGHDSLVVEFKGCRWSPVAHLIVEDLGEVLRFLIGDWEKSKFSFETWGKAKAR